MSFISTYSSLSARGWQSGTGGQQIYSLIATQIGPQAQYPSPNANPGYFGQYVAISDYNISGYNLCLVGGYNDTTFPNGYTSGSFTSTAFNGIRQLFTGTPSSFSFGSYCSMSSDAKYAAVIGNGIVGSRGNINIYSSDANYNYSLQFVNTASNGTYFGSRLSMNNSGNSVAITRRATDIVDIYTRSINTWSFSTSITPNVGNIPQVGFGDSVAYGDSNTIIVGAAGNPTTPGTAFIYVNNSQVARIFPSISSNNDSFGISVAMSSDTNYAVVGARSSSSTGRAFVFANVANTWTELAILTPSSTKVTNDQFGGQVAISNNGNTVIVADPQADSIITGVTQGAVYIFTKDGNSYIQIQELIDPTGNVSPSLFGEGIALTNDGKRLIVGDLHANNNNGAAYLFQSFY